MAWLATSGMGQTSATEGKDRPKAITGVAERRYRFAMLSLQLFGTIVRLMPDHTAMPFFLLPGSDLIGPTTSRQLVTSAAIELAGLQRRMRHSRFHIVRHASP